VVGLGTTVDGLCTGHMSISRRSSSHTGEEGPTEGKGCWKACREKCVKKEFISRHKSFVVKEIEKHITLLSLWISQEKARYPSRLHLIFDPRGIDTNSKTAKDLKMLIVRGFM